MLYNIPCRIYILSTLSLCISGIVSTATATSSETKISNEETLVVTTNRSASNLWESPATIQVIDQQTLQNSTNASIADNLQDIPGVEITDNSLAGRKQIRIRGEASSRVLILIDGQEVTYQRAGDNYGVGLLIDESALERVEVVKGPYSVLYGSQAIGGIVNFITKKGGDKLASGVVKAVYNSATAGWEESIAVQGASVDLIIASTVVILIRAIVIRRMDVCRIPTIVTIVRVYGWVITPETIVLASRLIATDSRRKLTMRIQTEAMRHLVSKYLNLNERKLGYSMTQTWTVTI